MLAIEVEDRLVAAAAIDPLLGVVEIAQLLEEVDCAVGWTALNMLLLLVLPWMLVGMSNMGAWLIALVLLLLLLLLPLMSLLPLPTA